MGYVSPTGAPGGATRPSSFRRVTARSGAEPTRHRTRALFYDTRGRGRSDPVSDPARLGIERELDDLDQLCAHFRLERFSFDGKTASRGRDRRGWRGAGLSWASFSPWRHSRR